MRRVIKELEALINERAPQKANTLISPRVTEPQRRSIQKAVEAWVGSMPADGIYLLRSDIGRGALVPTGPERLQMHVNGTVRAGDFRERGNVFLELEAVESGGSRRWLLVGLAFPGQSEVFVGGLPPETPFVFAAAFALVILGVAIWLARRFRRQARP